MGQSSQLPPADVLKQREIPLTCGSDFYRQVQAQNDPSLTQRQDQVDQAIYLDLDHQNTLPGAQKQGAVYTIPVVVHLIHAGFPISNQQVLDAIEQLNQAFRNLGPYNQGVGADVEIEFCLAQRDTNGNLTNGITRTITNLANVNMATQDLQMKNLSRWDPTRYLNIWVVNHIFGNGSVAGYATLPGAHGLPVDGIVIDNEYFGTRFQNSSVLAHEAGHYLGLYHTFEGRCPNNNCLLDGDQVCDTPPDTTQFENYYCGIAHNSCTSDADDLSVNNPFRPVNMGGLGDQPDLSQNYMDYEYLHCLAMFTDGQKNRMRSALTGTRSSLLGQNVCSSPCALGTTAAFSPTVSNLNIGGQSIFINASTNATNYVWKVGGGIFSTNFNSVYTFSNVGTYTITLIASNGTDCIDSVSHTVVVSCSTIADFSTSTDSIVPPGAIAFTDASTNANNIEWVLDGVSLGGASSVLPNFNTPGIFQMQLIAHGGNCSDTTNHRPVYAGVCEPLRNNIWNFGQFAGLDFTSGTPVSNGGHSMFAYEDCQTMCDPQGNLLFYCNGGPGNFNMIGGVWNRNHQLMPNGLLDPSSGCTSAAASALSIPRPGVPNQYYLFTNGCSEFWPPELKYHIVDMTMDGGLGDIVQKNTLVTSDVFEEMAITRHCNGKDYWLLTHNRSDFAFKSYQVTQNGIFAVNTTPPPNNTGVGGMGKFAPNSSYYAKAQVNNVHLFPFDNASGILGTKLVLPVNFRALSVVFSPDSRYLYASGRTLGGTHHVARWDLQATNIAASFTTVSTRQGVNLLYSTHFGPDGKIYVNVIGETALSVIDVPNAPAGANDVDWYSVSTAPYLTELSLPVSIPHYYWNPEPVISGPDSVCLGPQSFFLSRNACANGEVVWDYRGGGTITSMGPTGIAIQFSSQGTDTLIVGDVGKCASFFDTLVVNISIEPLPMRADTAICLGDSLLLTAGNDPGGYVWQDGSSGNTHWATTPGIYWAEPASNITCYGRGSVLIGEANVPIPEVNLGEDTVLCDNETLLLTAPLGPFTYLWQDGSTDSTFLATGPGTYGVTLTNSCGDTRTDSITIDLCVSIEEQLLNDLIVYPNPNSGSFFVDFGAPLGANCSFRLMDVRGRSVGQLVQEWQTPNRVIRLATEGLAAGLYALEIRVGEHVTYRKVEIW